MLVRKRGKRLKWMEMGYVRVFVSIVTVDIICRRLEEVCCTSRTNVAIRLRTGVKRIEVRES